MKPQTEIRYSWIYNRHFNPNFSKKDLFKLKKDYIKFKKLYKKYINTIIKLIEKHHSKRWKHKFIPIYIVKNASHSFSDPLTLRYRKDEKYLLVVLAHELLHNNIVKKKFKNPKELHIYMEPLLNKVIFDMPIDLKDELNLFNKRIRKHYDIK